MMLLNAQSQQNTIDELEIKEKEKKRREIRNSYCYYIKDYIFFFSLMISSSMNFNYLYFPLTLIGVIHYYFSQNKKILGLPENGVHQKHLKLGYLSLTYSLFLLIFKIICLYLVKNDNTFIFENKDIFLDLGICYLRDINSNFYFIMTFLGESIVILLSLISIIMNCSCNTFRLENDSSLKKSNFWTSRYLVIFNYLFVLTFAVFNTSFLTLFYILSLQILFFLCSIKVNEQKLEKFTKIIFIILNICILIQIVFINIFNVPRMQVNILYDKYIKDQDGYLKTYSIFTEIGINYSYNNKLSIVWKEWVGYLFGVLSLVTLTFSINKLKANELNLPLEKDIIKEENGENINSDEEIIPLEKKSSKENKNIHKEPGRFYKFITSPIFILQLCRVISIFYIYFYPNFFSIGILVTFSFSSLYLDVNKNKNLTVYLLTPMVIFTIMLYHISNINGLFEDLNDEEKRKYLNFALGKYEYSYLEYFGHNLFYIFIMFLIYSFGDSPKKEKEKIINEKDIDLINDNEIKSPLLCNTFEIDNDNQEEKDIIIKNKKDLTFWNLLIKLIFTHIDKLTLIAMYFTSMRSINLIHLILVIIFLIQILSPQKIHKIYSAIIIILQILFLIIN